LTRERDYEKQKIAEELEPVVEEAQERVEKLGLSPRDVEYWINHNDEVNQLAAYGGFQERYPHWRWGMKYDKQRKQGEFGGGKIFEMVINNDPCHAYLQMSNDFVDQKSVITHVEAHSDFFANNNWFQDSPRAVDMLSRHAERIEDFMEDPEIERSEVERWIDYCLSLEDNIDQYSEYALNQDVDEEGEDYDPKRAVENLNLSDSVEDTVFDDGFYEDNPQEVETIYEQTTEDIYAFLIENGKQYDKQKEEAVEYEDWQIEILDMLREEAYYFAPQKMTKVMNEGWASQIESLVMTDETFADVDEIVDYADQHSKVIQSGQFNPYRLGKALWEHIENTVNRREVVDKLLRVDGISPENFHPAIDFDEIFNILYENRNEDDVVERNYSLTRSHNKGFVQDISLDELRKINRYIVNRDKYQSIEQALSDVDYHRGWDRIKEVRETHNDVMFIDEFLTQEFVDSEEYFTYEYRASHQQSEIASRDVDDVRKKLLLQFTNFGKPTIEAVTANFNNSSELLLLHKFNGVVLNSEEVEDIMENIFEMWGRPVHLGTIAKKVPQEEMDYAFSEEVEPEFEEVPLRIEYGGEEFYEHSVSEGSMLYRNMKADDIDYNTKPEDWL
jgi:stage V sporulation protein R